MTIAACYVSGEGVVLGADSASTMMVAGRGADAPQSEHYFDHAQKLFEVGEGSTLGIVTWGMGNLGDTSHRTLIALFADDLKRSPAGNMTEVAQRWNAFFWNAYTHTMDAELRRVQQLLGLSQPTEAERTELNNLRAGLSGGFCIGGHLIPDRVPAAFKIEYDPTLTAPGPVKPVEPAIPQFWGMANLIERIILGIDIGLLKEIARSRLWTGTLEDLYALLGPYTLGQPRQLPLREALDWIHAAISATIKSIKFSHREPTSGGAVDLAVIPTDQPFRWVRQKGFDSALGSGGPCHV